MFQMVTANPPWKSLDHKNPIALLLHLKSTVGCPPPFDSNSAISSDHQLCHPEVHQIMELCFQRNPKDRPSARRLLRHAFFTRSSFDDDVDTNIAAPVKKIMSRVPGPQAFKPTVPIIEQLLKTITLEDERAHTALSPQIFTDQASHSAKSNHNQNDASSQVSRGTRTNGERHQWGDAHSSHKETRAQATQSLAGGGVSRRLPPAVAPIHSAAKQAAAKLVNRANDSRHIPPLSHSSRRSNAKPVTQHDASTVSSPSSPCPDEPIVYFELTYSNSNESEDLPVSIHPLGAEVTSPLSNCSSTGDNSAGMSVSSQPIISDNWPCWAKERAVQLEENKKGRLVVQERQYQEIASHQSSKQTAGSRMKERNVCPTGCTTRYTTLMPCGV